MRPTIVFSHANGFPAGTYHRLFESWRRAGYAVAAVERFGHDPAYPVSNNWPRLREELLHLMEAQGQPVFLVGHSMGGYVSLLAACKRPALVRGVVLIDSPLVGGWRAHSLHAMKLGGLMKRFSPGRVSARRRWQWPSVDAAWQHFAAKAAFARWHPDVLRDYIDAGTEADPDAGTGAVRLAFHRDVETHIYNTLPHQLQQLLRKHPLRVPVHYLAGTRSAEGRQAGMAATRALVHGHITWLEGSHLFPMEKPDETAAAVLECLAQMTAPSAAPATTATHATAATSP